MRIRIACLLVLLCGYASVAHAYPDKAVRIVVGFPPGGGADVVARLLAQKLQQTWGQSVIVDNRAGAGGIIGSEIVAHAEPSLLIVGSEYADRVAPLRELLPQLLHLVHLAAQPDHHVAADVRMPRDAGGDTLEQFMRRTGLDAAPDLVGERHHAINARKVSLEVRPAETVGHVTRNAGRAVHTGNDREVIPRADLARGARIAPELTHRGSGA